ncbi:MAG: hypothetical protein J6B09_03675 [Clostridia bacterium]|nr:hypothetical protein [Clostridia bacterium]
MKKRVLSFLMCIAVLMSSVAILSSCKKADGDIKTSSKVVDVDLTGYSIVSGADLTESGQQHVLAFAQNLSKVSTVDMSVITDTSEEETSSDKPEILVGQTSRKESSKVLNSIKGAGWAIRVMSNKIVIVGTTPYLTRVALTHFERTYINAEHFNATILSTNDKIAVSRIPTIPLVDTVDGTDSTFVVVYEKGKDKNDAPNQIGTQTANSIFERTGVSAMVVTSNSDVQEKEILVGSMSRLDVKEQMAKIEADEYAVMIENGKIYLVAWSDDVLPSAYELFQDMLFGSSYTDDDGNTFYEIPSNCTVVQTFASDWFTDFPKPEAEGLYPEAAVDANDGALQYIYSGEGATRETFVAYCETLKAAGYRPVGNEDVQWEGSSFRTFVHDEKGVSLQVSHMAFAHAATQKVEGLVNSIRIVSGSTAWGGTVVDEKYLRPQIEGTEEEVKNGTADYVRRMNSQITCNMIDYSSPANWGLGQVITLADGSFIIIDGGRAKGADETANVWTLMREMHKKAYGEYPTKEHPVHIRAWLITHEHGDHHNILMNFTRNYGFLPEVRMDYLMENFGSMTQLRAAGGNYNVRNNIKQLQEKVKNGFEYIQVNTGNVFYFANCRFEILVTIDDMYPWRCSETNNATTVTRTALLERDDAGNSCEITSLWLGDAEWQQSRVARAMYGPFLDSDHIQVAHHGSSGGSEKELYQLVGNCSVIWFPTCVNRATIERCLDNNWSYSPSFKNPECKLMIFNGSEYNMYPRWEVTLTLTATGALYDQLYDASTGELLDAKGEVWPAVDVQAYREAVGR